MNDGASFGLSDWLDYLESRQAVEIQLGLDRVRGVAAQLGLLSFNVPVITVAGTNGKGSTVAALTGIYLAAGYSVGTYTSPHLLRFNERICINQVSISDNDLCRAFSVIHELPDSRALTYFEMSTLAALLYFKWTQPEVIVLEVGMGGRLDATNIIDADASILTTIDFDHQAFLGNTRDEIGYEKAGIMRPDKPMIYADLDAPSSVRAYAKKAGATAYYLGESYTFDLSNDVFVLSLAKDRSWCLPIPLINVKAMVSAIVLTRLLDPLLPVTEKAWVEAILCVRVPARLQRVVDEEGVHHVFDVAHNPQAVRLLVDYLETHRGHGKIYAVFSGLKDKDLCGLIKPMSDLVHAWYPALLSGSRAADALCLQTAFSDAIHCSPYCYEDPVQAYDAAKCVAGIGDCIVVYGSFLTVGAVMACRVQIEENS